MRLPTDYRTRFFALGLTALLAACGRGGNDNPALVSATDSPSFAANGPAADYPVVVGEPYTSGGTLYTPLDTMNYDEVGYALADAEGGSGVTVAHRTLPMPSYVEVTALDTGKTILARVERRGPTTESGVVGLSNGARQQLEIANGAPIRIRRVNPPEVDRMKLRVGEAAPARMNTPKSLLAVLKRKLPEAGAVSLAATNPAGPVNAATLPTVGKNPVTKELPAAPVRVATAQPAPASKPSGSPFEKAFESGHQVAKSYPLPPLGGAKTAATPRPVRVASRPAPQPIAAALPPRTVSAVPKAPEAKAPEASTKGNFVVQAAAFSSKANAERLASSINGFVQQSGSYYRVRKGPFVNRGQAEAALAKIRAAGYSDARVFTAG